MNTTFRLVMTNDQYGQNIELSQDDYPEPPDDWWGITVYKNNGYPQSGREFYVTGSKSVEGVLKYNCIAAWIDGKWEEIGSEQIGISDHPDHAVGQRS